MEKILIVDGSSLFFRAFYALPLLQTKKGIYTNAIYGFVMMLENAIEKINPDYVAVCFDRKGKTFRHNEYKDYKGTRQKTPSELDQQFPLVMEVLKLMNIRTLDSDIYEADDIAGTLSKIAEEQGIESYMLTGDKDYFQLIDKNSKVLFTKKGITEMDIYDLEKFKEEYEISPMEFIDLKGLMGDTSDNIPGVKGIGEKTGLKLIREFGSIENIYENIDKVNGAKLVEKLENEKPQAFLSKRLATIIRNVPLEITLDDLKKVDYDYESLIKMYEEFEFNSLLKRIPQEYLKKETVEVDLDYFYNKKVEDVVKKLEGENSIAFKILTDGKIYQRVTPAFIGIKGENSPAYIFDFNGDVLEGLRGILESEKIEIIGHDIKEDLLVTQEYNISVEKIVHDGKIAEYIIKPEYSNYDINVLSDKYLGIKYMDLEEILGKGKKKEDLLGNNREEIKKYLSFLLNSLFKIKVEQLKIIHESEMDELYYKIELPLTEVLSSMEYIGIEVLPDVLENIGEELEERIEVITGKIYEEAGEEFNINSPKQLGIILFEKLGYPVIKKTKTGYSTGADVLEKLVGAGPLAGDILEYRKLTKLKSTYVDGLSELIVDGKIHSSFNQTVAVTGRISSTEPNLQNIPIRTEEGRLIRKAFVAGENKKLVDADYSQIELRVLAHISEDENMIDAFKHNADIHATTASEIFNVPMEEMTPEIRYRAKEVNFGIVYGISDYGLSQNINIPRATAKKYIESYLNHYKGVQRFMTEIVEEGKAQGYVETIFHRKRYIPELNSKNFNIRAFGERVALNTPIQGSAADIIKVAMVEVYRELKERGLKSRLILQIHDELIVLTYEEELEEVKELLKSTMESAVQLRVPILVDLQVGDSWYDTK